MSVNEKRLQRLRAKPPPKDYKWDELVALLNSLGFDLDQSGGSSHCFFVNRNDVDFMIHTYRPHPSGILYQKQIKEIVHILQNRGVI